MSDLEWVRRSDWEWRAEALYEDGVRVTPRWEVWRRGDREWCPNIDGADLYPFARSTDVAAMEVAQILENLRRNLLPGQDVPRVIDASVLDRLHEWNLTTFGPGERTEGTLAHISSELVEIAADPGDVTEWADVIILSFNGAMRVGHEPQTILDAIRDKLVANEARTWPDWRDVPEGTPIEHLRGSESAKAELKGVLEKNYETGLAAIDEPDLADQ